MLQEQVRSLENSLEGRGPVDALLLRIQWDKSETRPSMSRASQDTSLGLSDSSKEKD